MTNNTNKKRKKPQQQELLVARQYSGKPRAWIFVAIAACCTAASAFGVVYSTYKARTLVSEFEQLQNQRNELQTEWGQLLLEQSTWGSLNRVEQLAKNKLNMHVPDPQQVKMVAQ